jgi:hypothetical protein
MRGLAYASKRSERGYALAAKPRLTVKCNLTGYERRSYMLTV